MGIASDRSLEVQFFFSSTQDCWAPRTRQTLNKDEMSSSTIQSFYRRESPSIAQNQTKPSAGPTSENDAFTEAELDAARRPLTQQWVPQGVYKKVTIDSLQPGPGKLRFTARIVNFSSAVNVGARSILPQNYHSLAVKDGTGVVVASSSSKYRFGHSQLTIML